MRFIDYFGKTFKIDSTGGDFGIEIETEVKSENCYPSGFITPQVTTTWSGLTKKFMVFPSYMSYWEGHWDNSLRNFGVEFVLKKPLDFPEFKKAMDQFGDLAAKVPFIQDAVGTSIHVHMNVQNRTLIELGNLLTLLVLFENILVEYSGEQRRSNLFALPIRCAEMNYYNIRNLFRDLAEGKLKAIQFNEEHVKYACINLGKLSKIGSIEIRCFKGSVQKDEIVDWVDILRHIKEFACTPRLTPLAIMAEMRDRPLEFFSEVFGRHAKTLRRIEDFEKHLMSSEVAQNLFYAAKISEACDWNRLEGIVKEASMVKYPEKILRYIQRYASHLSPDQLMVDANGEVVMKNDSNNPVVIDYGDSFEASSEPEILQTQAFGLSYTQAVGLVPETIQWSDSSEDDE